MSINTMATITRNGGHHLIPSIVHKQWIANFEDPEWQQCTNQRMEVIISRRERMNFVECECDAIPIPYRFAVCDLCV